MVLPGDTAIEMVRERLARTPEDLALWLVMAAVRGPRQVCIERLELACPLDRGMAFRAENALLPRPFGGDGDSAVSPTCRLNRSSAGTCAVLDGLRPLADQLLAAARGEPPPPNCLDPAWAPALARLVDPADSFVPCLRNMLDNDRVFVALQVQAFQNRIQGNWPVAQCTLVHDWLWDTEPPESCAPRGPPRGCLLAGDHSLAMFLKYPSPEKQALVESARQLAEEAIEPEDETQMVKPAVDAV